MSIHAADYPRHRPKTDDIPANNKLNTFNNNHQPSATFAPLPISTTPSPFLLQPPLPPADDSDDLATLFANHQTHTRHHHS